MIAGRKGNSLFNYFKIFVHFSFLSDAVSLVFNEGGV